MKTCLITSKKEYRYWFIFSHQKFLRLYTTKDRNREPLTTKNPQNTDVWLWKRKSELVVLVWLWYKWGWGHESQQKNCCNQTGHFSTQPHLNIYSSSTKYDTLGSSGYQVVPGEDKTHSSDLILSNQDSLVPSQSWNPLLPRHA